MISSSTNTDNYNLPGNRNITIVGYFRGYAPVSWPCVIWGKKYIYYFSNIVKYIEHDLRTWTINSQAVGSGCRHERNEIHIKLIMCIPETTVSFFLGKLNLQNNKVETEIFVCWDRANTSGLKRSRTLGDETRQYYIIAGFGFPIINNDKYNKIFVQRLSH